MISTLLKSIVMGFSLAAPIGPVSVLCMQRVLHKGFWEGIYFGLSSAIALAITAVILAFLSSFLIHYQKAVAIIGGLFLLYMGIKMMMQRANVCLDVHKKKSNFINDLFSTFLLTITNPLIVIVLVGFFAALNLHISSGYSGLLIMAGGVFLGTMTWWSLLSFGVSLLRAKVDRAVLGLVNKISGVIIAAFGILAIASIARM